MYKVLHPFCVLLLLLTSTLAAGEIHDAAQKGNLETPRAMRITSEDVIHTLADLFIERGAPIYLRSDNGLEFTAKAVRDWLERLRVQTPFIESGCPREKGYVESFNGKLRDELLNREILYKLKEAEVLLERWRIHCNTKRPHSSLGHRPPASEAIQPPSNHLSLN